MRHLNELGKTNFPAANVKRGLKRNLKLIAVELLSTKVVDKYVGKH